MEVPFGWLMLKLLGFSSWRREDLNVKSESSVLRVKLARPARLLSLLALSAFKPAKRPITNSCLARHACWAHIRNLRSPKVFKIRRGGENQASSSVGKKKQNIKTKRRHFSSHFHFTIPFPSYFILVIVLLANGGLNTSLLESFSLSTLDVKTLIVCLILLLVFSASICAYFSYLWLDHPFMFC